MVAAWLFVAFGAFIVLFPLAMMSRRLIVQRRTRQTVRETGTERNAIFLARVLRPIPGGLIFLLVGILGLIFGVSRQ
jgi:hypothetical protein